MKLFEYEYHEYEYEYHFQHAILCTAALVIGKYII